MKECPTVSKLKVTRIYTGWKYDVEERNCTGKADVVLHILFVNFVNIKQVLLC